MNLDKQSQNGPQTHCGYIAIIGRPNVGKSTLLNRIVGEKISITSKKPQTTRHRILGIKTKNEYQMIYVDTPGLHQKEPHAINRYMNKAARAALKEVDVILFLIEALKWTEDDEWIFHFLSKLQQPILLVVNKVDTVPNKELLLPYLKELASKTLFKEIIPISASKGDGVLELENTIQTLIPESPHYFPEGEVTDRNIRFRVAEIIREKLVRFLGQELPYTTTVELNSLKQEQTKSTQKNIYHIQATIWVERENQKPIVIGKNGERLKKIGMEARRDLEGLLKTQVHLNLWVKVKGGWTDDERALASLGLLE